MRKLTFDLNFKRVDVSLLKSLLPNVSNLAVRLSHALHNWNDLPSLPVIFDLWPGLQELRIVGVENHLMRNYDAHFCGINQEEVKLLREKAEDFLQAVHIVPIRL